MTVVNRATALSALPAGLKTPLMVEFDKIVSNFMDHRWTTVELSGGRFCEIVYTIISGYASGSYAASPMKPTNFVDACRGLESNTSLPRSFQILIPRLLPALYEIRNNRNVGHVGGDVNPDFMDSSAVLSISSWILAELVRVFHNTSTQEAQRIVDELAERRIPLVWQSGGIRRVLKPNLPLRSQILLLLASSSTRVQFEELLMWTGYKNKSYFKRLLDQLHELRLIEFHGSSGDIELLPPGTEEASAIAIGEFKGA